MYMKNAESIKTNNYMRCKKYFLHVLFSFIAMQGAAQEVNLDSLLDAEMDKKNKSETQYAEATFKSTRLINGHSVEGTQKGVLDFRVSHRFGTLNQGFYELFGLDQASMRFGFDYGITKRLSVGLGRSTFEKQYDGFAKYRLLWQSTGKHNVPISLTWVSGFNLKTVKNSADTVKRNSSDRWSYFHQAILARKFSSDFSLQVMPTLIHYNIVPTSDLKNDVYAVGIGGRIKISKRVSLNGEYYYVIKDNKFPDTYNTFSVGFDIETGGHVFQLHLTNSTGMTERTFISETKGKWGDGDIHFGFNISRVFTIQKPKTAF